MNDNLNDPDGVRVFPVATRKDRRRFLLFPWTLYRTDPYWIPPLRTNQEELVNYRPHPFYDDAEIQTFLAEQDGVVVGRVAAILNHAHNRTHPDDTCGFIGFFESIDSQAVANALLGAARDWLNDRDMSVVRGPVNPSLNYECGMLVENFERQPTFMMTYNPSYYPVLWESFGFVKSQDLYSYVGYKEQLDTIDKKIGEIARHSAKRFNVRVRGASRTHFQKDVETFLNIYNASLTGVWGHVPMSTKEVRHVAKAMKWLIVRDLTLIAEVEGKAVGAILGLLDFNGRVREMDGKLFPFGFLKLLFGRRDIKRIRMVSTNVLPEYKMWGVGVILAAHILQPALNHGTTESEFSWVLESNHLSRKTLERADLEREKVHRIYDYVV